MLGVASTGSYLIWTQCEPCKKCYNQTLPIFDPRRSSTHQNLSCDPKPACKYSHYYGGYTKGVVAAETLTFDITQPISLPNVLFGCGHDNGGTFDKLVSGVIGLGGGQLSLISQLDRSVGRNFSYRLVPLSYTATNVSGKISFGGNVVTSASGVTTPLVSKQWDTYYKVLLEAISIGNKRIAYRGCSETVSDTDDEMGNTVIDSGTTLTLLQQDLFEDVLKALDKTIKARRREDPRGALSRCFETGGSHSINLPNITAHFKGADAKLQPLNTFQNVAADLVCFTMIASSGNVSIYGNLAQTNFLVGYDLEARTLSFLPTDCTIQ